MLKLYHHSGKTATITLSCDFQIFSSLLCSWLQLHHLRIWSELTLETNSEFNGNSAFASGGTIQASETTARFLLLLFCLVYSGT